MCIINHGSLRKTGDRNSTNNFDKFIPMKILKIIIISTILFSIFGCNTDEDINTYEGNIVGFVSLCDENGNWLKDKSGVNVSVEGTEHSTLTNEDGWFELT